MKKLLLTITIATGLALTSFAEPNGGGVFQRGNGEGGYRDGELFNAPALPAHGMGTNQPAPLGGGIMVLTAFGAAYLIGKRRREE